MTFRKIVIEDHGILIEFWKSHYLVNEMDSFERFKLFLEKNPDMSFLAEEDGKIVGTALGSFDGRRGYLQKVAVDTESRRKGLGQQLVKKVIEKLRELNALYVPISVEQELVSFYEKCGFKKTEQIPMNTNPQEN